MNQKIPAPLPSARAGIILQGTPGLLAAVVLILLGGARPAWGQTPVRYDISFPNYLHHEAYIVLRITDAGTRPLLARMSRSSAGRYATHEFDKNVYGVHAWDPGGRTLDIRRVEDAPGVYRLASHGDTVLIGYTVFGNYADGTYADIDATEARLNMPAIILWREGRMKDPITLRFHIPRGLSWKIATQLKPGPDPRTFYAPGFQYLMDSPTELSDFSLRQWSGRNPDGKILTFRLIVHSDGVQDSTLDHFEDMVRRIVRQEKAVFGQWPDYDYGTYTFIENANPYMHGDGMEHRNSTFISYPAALAGHENQLASITAHEFFHGWNVKRIRPRDLQPFNFRHSNMSGSLWFAEGFTQYYGELTLERTGLITRNSFIHILGSYINYVLNAPGSYQNSPVWMSQESVYADAGISIDRNNFPNIFTSYYYYGAITALALDLSLRERFPGLNLDGYMRAVWKQYGKPFIPYTNGNLELALARYTRHADFAASFFRHYIRGTDKPRFKDLLAKAGYLLDQPRASQAWLGLNGPEIHQGVLFLSRPSRKGSPAYRAGLDRDDTLLSLDGSRINSLTELEADLKEKNPGDTLLIRYEHRGILQDTRAILRPNPTLDLIPGEDSGWKLSPAMQNLRAQWLDSRIKP